MIFIQKKLYKCYNKFNSYELAVNKNLLRERD